MRSARRRAAATVFGSAAAFALVAAPATATAPVPSTPSTSSSHGRYLDLDAVSGNGFEHLAPGDTVGWQLRLTSRSANPTTAVLWAAAQGALTARPGALVVSVRSCTVRWTGPTCNGVAHTWMTARSGPGMDGGSAALGEAATRRPTWLLVTATVPADAGSDAENLHSTLTVGADTSGGSVPSAPGSLPLTGADLVGEAALGFAAVASGFALTTLARRRAERRGTTDADPFTFERAGAT